MTYTHKFIGPDPWDTERAEFRHGNIIATIPCNPCRVRLGRDVCHRHFSSDFHRSMASYLQDEEPWINCPTCKFSHPVDVGDTRRIVIFSSSTLHNCILDRNVRTSCHLDVETICGAKTADLHRTWQATYSSSTKPCDVILVTGVNDIPSTPVEELKNILNTWSFELTRQNPTSTLRVCRMLTPPAKGWFPANGPLPLTNYTNHLNMITEVNNMICNINQLNAHDWVIGFTTEGCRSTIRGGVRKVSHNFGAWREISQGKHRCMHLNERHRVIMFRKLLQFITSHVIQPNVIQPNAIQ